MQDYTLSIQAKIKQQEAQRETNQRVLIREIENARHQADDKRKGVIPQNTPLTHQDSHN